MGRSLRLPAILIGLCLLLSASICHPLPATAQGNSTHTEQLVPSGDEFVYTVYTVQTPDGTITVELPSEAITAPTNITITQGPLEDLPPAPSGLSFANTTFAIEGLDDLEEEAVVTVKYSEEDLQAADDSPYLLVLSYYDEANHEWVTLQTTQAPDGKSLKALTNGLGQWAVMVEEPHEGVAGLSVGSAILLGLLVAIVGAVAIGIVVDRKAFPRGDSDAPVPPPTDGAP
jgi:hypothetical protein